MKLLRKCQLFLMQQYFLSGSDGRLKIHSYHNGVCKFQVCPSLLHTLYLVTLGRNFKYIIGISPAGLFSSRTEMQLYISLERYKVSSLLEVAYLTAMFNPLRANIGSTPHLSPHCLASLPCHLSTKLCRTKDVTR